MNLNNRYVQLTGLWLGIAVLIYLVLWLVLTVLDLSDFPVGLRLVLAVLGSGLLVYKFLANRIA